ncbi:exodeoxyribonuclease VII large subunit [Parvularcula sp. LCG005]|uniref:exodeoxyribonuclease VII large subunit n=1 Tax=Parvularcula sp. LCG005 TaxID=3078805 RepID=UPI0029436CB9|nr:exodeoxyribonuclease VII large subunit [Parvularcula sp. LCG005]WOI53597.1 exodeoxyribonuclease VII large subunit [Parvularcula sp. LCG005]
MSSNVAEYTVSELSSRVQRTIEDSFGYVRVKGELGRVTKAGSGHVYLDLKDDRASLSAVAWKGVAAKFAIRPEQGMEVVVTGRMTTFPGQSKYQLIIDTLEPAGEGALMALLEARKKALAAEGLFDPSRKRPLPFLPRVIGVVTSPSGAVIRDILHRLRDRFPSHVLVWPTLVQGDKAPAQIIAGIEGFNRLPTDGSVPRPDVLIVARGGGSLEDLWCFNDEAVARAAAASEIPLISAVGHETDTTLIDFVADRRAPTPTAAAEMAVPVRMELLQDLATKESRLSGATMRLADRRLLALTAASRGLGRPEGLLQTAEQRFDRAAERLSGALVQKVDRATARLSAAHMAFTPRRMVQMTRHAEERLGDRVRRMGRTLDIVLRRRQQELSDQGRLLESYSYRSVLDRGFALVLDNQGHVLRRAENAVAGASGTIRFADGERAVQFGPGSTPPQQSTAKPTPPKKQPAKKPTPKAQGGLFD